jgi:hypothetical protein
MKEFRKWNHVLWLEDQAQLKLHQADSNQPRQLWGWILEMHAFMLALDSLHIEPIVREVFVN